MARRRDSPLMFILRLTRPQAPSVPPGRSGLARALGRLLSSRNSLCSTALQAAVRTRGRVGFRISTLPRSRGIRTPRNVSPSVAQLAPANEHPAPSRSSK
jgi:hypothetical protein